MKIPTLVVWGEASHPAACQANDLLSRYIPRADHATIAGASHFMIATHPKSFAELIVHHIERSSQALAAAQ
jgi:pimeloyl-ACP methyl ester carboxylesterase